MKEREKIKSKGKVWDWSEEEIKRFKEETEEVELRRENIDGKLEKLKERMEEIKDKIGKRGKKRS